MGAPCSDAAKGHLKELPPRAVAGVAGPLMPVHQQSPQTPNPHSEPQQGRAADWRRSHGWASNLDAGFDATGSDPAGHCGNRGRRSRPRRLRRKSLPNSRIACKPAVCRERLLDLETLARQCDELAAMDFTFCSTRPGSVCDWLQRHRAAAGYELLRSAGLGSAPVQLRRHRPGAGPAGALVLHGPAARRRARGEPILVSWSGSMFEYLMPLLVMPTTRTRCSTTPAGRPCSNRSNTALRGVPWGISESGYNRTDAHLNYQYRAFGVPGLGLKRGLAEDLVIAPYASVHGVDGRAAKACENLQRLAAEGARRLRFLRGGRLHAEPACRPTKPASPSDPSWPIIRA
jgi:hypothetical protein